jgi:hypothetical protein
MKSTKWKLARIDLHHPVKVTGTNRFPCVGSIPTRHQMMSLGQAGHSTPDLID